MGAVPLRRRLFLLAAVGILPMAVMSGLGLIALVRQQRTQAEGVGRELARAVATAVDAELRSSIAVLDSLSTTVALDQGDTAAFYERARSVLRTQPHWDGVTLFDPRGVRLADTRLGYATALPPPEDRESFDRLLSTERAVVGNLLDSPNAGLVFRVRVPVIRNGLIRYVLTAVVMPGEIRDVLVRQQLPSDWVISIFDANGRRVARSRAHEANLGGRASPTLQALMASGEPEGFGVTFALEGDRIYTPYSRLPSSNWSAALGIPAALVDGAVRRSLQVYGGGIALSLAVGILAAVFVARTIKDPIDGLRASARSLGRGETVTPASTSIHEIQEVASALMAAARERGAGEAEREDLLQKEREAREAAETADRAKDEFLAVLSHELRTPLNAVYGWARLLQDARLDDDAARRALDAIVRNAHQQVQLIDDLLDVSRIVAGKLRLDVRTVDLPGVIEEAAETVGPAAGAKGIRIQKILDPRAGPVSGDSGRLQQVVWNLLMNAVKFTPKGGRVRVELKRVNSHVEIVVSDNGRGIGPAMLPFVFDRFRQSDSSSTRAHGGLGIGLALAKHLVDLHGGTISARSEGEGQGATFTVSLPLASVGAAAEPALRVHPKAPSLATLPDAVRLEGLRILALDDEPDSLGLVEAVLTGAGAEVKTARAAAEALDEVQRWRPDVFISDIEMPDEDGYSLIAKIRQLPIERGGRTPAVALTAYGRIQDRMRSLASGYNMHLPKPVDPAELTAVIASLAGRA